MLKYEFKTIMGLGNTLRNSGKETRHIAASHQEEIQMAVKAFFLDTYKTEVMVHNIIGAVDGASVFDKGH